MKKAIKTAVLVYLAASLLLSVLVSSCILPHGEVITRRAPFLVLDLCYSGVEGIHPDGRVFGYNERGYIGFGRDESAFPLGSHVLTLFVWNPLNNECDDILARYDLCVFP